MSNNVGARWIFADLELSRRLEFAEAHANIEFVEARARAFPRIRAQWMEVAGAFAMFDGPESPLSQTFGLGMAQPVTPADLARIEAFFLDLGAPVYHEVSPLADPSALNGLNQAGYEPFEFTNILFRPLGPGATVSGQPNEGVKARLIAASEVDLWASTSARGWSENPELGDFLLTLGQVGAKRPGALSFLAEANGKAIAAAGMTIHKGVACLAGASTVPEGRRQGAQLALLEARLRYATGRGCDVAMMGALPGSASQRNAERQGFQIAYTRIKWRRKAAA